MNVRIEIELKFFRVWSSYYSSYPATRKQLTAITVSELTLIPFNF